MSPLARRYELGLPHRDVQLALSRRLSPRPRHLIAALIVLENDKTCRHSIAD